jgi:hypothetical protein
MRTKTRPGAKNFEVVVHPARLTGTTPVRRGTKVAFGEKNLKRLEAVALINDKY